METEKYVPNSGQGRTYLENSLQDSLASLEILFANEYETFSVPKDTATCTEAYFYRGGQVQWLNFYLAEKEAEEDDSPGLSFVKRDGYSSVARQVEQQMKSRMSVCSVYLSHEPGSGGTTLAMQVLWNFRKRLRCAVLRDSEANAQDIANQIIALYKAGGPNNQNTVLLLIDNLPKMETQLNSLVRCMTSSQVDGNIPVVIILKCQRVILCDGQCKTDITCCKELSDHEKEQFIEKEDVFLFHGQRSEGLHGFNIMRHGFSEEYVRRLVSPVMNEVKPAAKNTKLLSILALLNLYVPGSSLLKSECQAFLGPPDPIHGGPSFEDRMEPFTGLLITFSRREKLVSHDCVRMAHPMIATYCCQVLEAAGLTLKETTMTLIENFDKEQRDKLLPLTINDLLVMRTTGKQFSPLIEDLRKSKPWDCVHVLKLVCKKYPRNAFILQALARFLDINLRYSEAEKYALEAKRAMPNNSFVADTLGQLHKHHLQKQKPDSLDLQLQLVTKAVAAFEEQWKVAEEEEEEAVPGDAEGPERNSHVFNCSGLLGFLQVASFVATEMRECLPSQQANEMGLMLTTKAQLPRGMITCNTLLKFQKLLTSFKDQVEEKFNFFERFLTYSERDKDQPYIRKNATSCYVKYVDMENEFSEQGADEIRRELKKRTAASFPGLLHCLEMNREIEEITEITKIWKKVVDLPSPADRLSDTLCYLLSNIALSCVCPGSEDILPFTELTSILQGLLRADHGPQHEPELYFLALVVLWPGVSIPSQDGDQQSNIPGEADYDLNNYVARLKVAFEQRYRKHLRSRNIRPHFFLREGKEYSRLLDLSAVKDFHQWRNEAVLKNAGLLRVQGVIRNREIFTCYGQQEVLVQAHNMAQVRSPGLVSFYLGFNIRGPVAFDIQYASVPVQPLF